MAGQGAFQCIPMEKLIMQTLVYTFAVSYGCILDRTVPVLDWWSGRRKL